MIVPAIVNLLCPSIYDWIVNHVLRLQIRMLIDSKHFTLEMRERDENDISMPYLHAGQLHVLSARELFFIHTRVALCIFSSAR